MEAKACQRCGVEKNLREFSPRTDGVLGRASYCRKCRNQIRNQKAGVINEARRAEYKNSAEVREKLAFYAARYRERAGESLRDKGRQRYSKIRRVVIEKYGGQCACCGESSVEFLSIDHIGERGCGQVDRKLRGGSTGVYRHLYANEMMPHLYRVLCHNCNLALGFYGYCPHTREGNDGGDAERRTHVGFDAGAPQVMADFATGQLS